MTEDFSTGKERAYHIRFMLKYEDCLVKRFASEKDYLYPVVVMRMRRTTKIPTENRVLRNQLAASVDVRELRDVCGRAH
jgi:hypothetical protein